ncbi:hypothetical protein ACHQM5_010112 [Ranunculus cassubicifolius]
MATPRFQTPKLNAIGIFLCVSLLSLLLPFVGDLAEKTPNSTSPTFIPGNSSANCVGNGNLAEKTPNSPSPIFIPGNSSANCNKEGSCIGFNRSLLPETFGKTEIYVHNVSPEGLSSGSEGNNTESPVSEGLLSDTSMDNAPIHSCEECQVSSGPPPMILPLSARPFFFAVTCAICGWATAGFCRDCCARILLEYQINTVHNPNQSNVSSQGQHQHNPNQSNVSSQGQHQHNPNQSNVSSQGQQQHNPNQSNVSFQGQQQHNPNQSNVSSQGQQQQHNPNQSNVSSQGNVHFPPQIPCRSLQCSGCGNWFHNHCLARWRTRSTGCPICRRIILYM